MPTLDTVHTLIAIGTSIVMCLAVWWKVSKDTELNHRSIELHTEEIAELRLGKTDTAVTAKLIAAVEKIELEIINHHTDFKIHRNEDSERRMSDLIASVTELSKENRSDHQVIMNKLGRVERLNGKP